MLWYLILLCTRFKYIKVLLILEFLLVNRCRIPPTLVLVDETSSGHVCWPDESVIAYEYPTWYPHSAPSNSPDFREHNPGVAQYAWWRKRRKCFRRMRYSMPAWSLLEASTCRFHRVPWLQPFLRVYVANGTCRTWINCWPMLGTHESCWHVRWTPCEPLYSQSRRIWMASKYKWWSEKLACGECVYFYLEHKIVQNLQLKTSATTTQDTSGNGSTVKSNADLEIRSVCA